MVAAVDQVDPQHAESFLLEGRAVVSQIDVEHHFRRSLLRLALEADTHPAASVFRLVIAPCGHGVGEGEEGGRIAPRATQPLEELAELVLQHGLEALPAHVARGATVDRVAHLHVIGGNGLGHRARGAAHHEEPARHFLASPDLRDGAVLASIEIEGEGFLPRARGVLGHGEIVVEGPRHCNRDSRPGTDRRYRTIRTTEAASNTAMTMLKTRRERAVRNTCCAVAPRASHTKQQGSAASTKSRASAAACWSALPAAACR